jgi:hypothetical protein
MEPLSGPLSSFSLESLVCSEVGPLSSMVSHLSAVAICGWAIVCSGMSCALWDTERHPWPLPT